MSHSHEIPRAGGLEVNPKSDLPAETSFLRSGLAIGIIYTIVMILIVYGAWTLITQDWAQHRKEEEVELSRLTRAQSEYIVHTLTQTTETMHTLADIIAFSRVPATTLRSRLNNEVTAGLSITPGLAQISIHLGKQLFLEKNRNGAAMAQSAAISDICPNDPKSQELHVFRVASEEVGNQTAYIALQRCLHPAHNYLGGQSASITAILDTEHFQHYFREMRSTPQDHFWLLSRTAGIVLRPYMSEASHQENVLHRLVQKAETASPTDIQSFGNPEFIGVARQIHAPSLYIVVTRPSAIARSGFNAMRTRVEIGVVTLAILLALLCWTIYHDAHRHAQSRAALQQLNASLEQRVKYRTSELEQSNRELMAFSYSISHDLRAPLRAINGFAYALKEDYETRLDEQGRDYLDRVYRASVRMGELIDELLALADVSRKPLNRKTVDITALAREIMGGLAHNSPGREFTFNLQEGMEIKGDEALLGNALSNLLHNAWKFTRSEPLTKISLECTTEGEFLHFVLTDNGIGFDMAHAKRLFQPFEQLHVELGYGGTGIGLASVRRIVERHGGRIWGESLPGRGARFDFVLPR